MGNEEETKGPGFTIVDKRGVDEEPGAEEQAAPERPSQRSLPEVDFGTFVISLGTSALYHMGMVPDPETGKPAEPNFPVARQTIDTVEMLQNKTQGNLSEEEANLIKNLLTELRMHYLEAVK
jgi:hypothetical protein